ncbi:hypothetical protein JCM17845_15470 [Iodidimonas gelatinilytica]|uniref:Uncharacterized protein n=1 Tax=Iodidimonas gelatinilytica TaxID=1236966 RepID=A0A5A7MZT7_9PROT|nr:hypothetical protein [Iodidimonas gelatinilytica]GER00924.1 hypothetical protein JCM17845_15470 [Iodidimonas gelatinilytica]
MGKQVRVRNRLFLFKHQSAIGVDAAPAATTDAIPIEQDGFSKTSGFRVEDVTEVTGSLDAGEPLVVGEPATISFRTRVRGAGKTYTDTIKPVLGRLLEVCGWKEKFTEAIADEALVSGTAIDATLGASFSAVAQAYRGMPLILSGAGVAGRTPIILDYNDAKVATLSESFETALGTSNGSSIPANYRYSPFTDDDADPMKIGTAYIYEDGHLYRYLDCRGDFTLEVTSGGVGFFTFTLTGVFAGRTEPGMPNDAVFGGAPTPFFRQGVNPSPAFLIDRGLAAVSRVTLTGGNTVASPPDPNSLQGFGAAIVNGRDVRLTIDPQTTDLATRDTLSDLEAQRKQPVAIQWGLVAGSRIYLSIPQGKIVGRDESESDGLQAEQLTVDATGTAGAAVNLTFA